MSYSWGTGHDPVDTDGLPITHMPFGSRKGGRPAQAASPPALDGAVGAARADALPRLAAELAPMVGVWQRLLVLHQPDRAGRCRSCTKGGTGLPSTPWPCSIHGIADLARHRHDSDRR